MIKIPQISPRQWFHICLFSTICVTPFGFPTILYRVLGHNAWFAIVLAYLLTIWNVYLTHNICQRFKQLNLVEWSKKLMGRLFGSCYAVGVILVFYLWGYLMLYIFLELIMYTQLPFTSRFILLFFTIGVAVYLLSLGLEGWVRWGELFSILLLLGLFIINVSQLFNSTFGNLLPFNELFQKSTNLLKPEIIASLFIFRGIFSLYFLYPYLKEGQTRRWSLFSITIAFIEIFLAVILPVMIFGTELAKNFRFPYQETLGTVSLLWIPIERISVLSPVLWQLIIMYVLCVSFFSVARGVTTLFQLKKERFVIYLVGLATLGLAMFPFGHQTILVFMLYWSIGGLILLTIIPTVIWTILKWKGQPIQ